MIRQTRTNLLDDAKEIKNFKDRQQEAFLAIRKDEKASLHHKRQLSLGAA